MELSFYEAWRFTAVMTKKKPITEHDPGTTQFVPVTHFTNIPIYNYAALVV